MPKALFTPTELRKIRPKWLEEYEEEGVTIQDIADRHRVSYGTARKILAEAGAEFKARGINFHR